ncbi:DUF6544 family protein [Caldithrix abyssi]
MKLRKKITVLLLTVTLTVGCAAMNKTVSKMFSHVQISDLERISEKDLQNLPQTVRNYLRYSGIVGKEKIKTVRLKQGGDFRLKPDQDFKTMKAVQYFNVDSMEFFWQGKVNIITATDRFLDGKGDLTVKLLGLIRVAYAEGPEVDQGEILRFLAEGVWFPSVFLNDFIQWEELDERTAMATITLKNLSASALFHFNEKNQVERITARRYMEKDGKFEIKDWEIRIVEYRAYHGINIPAKSEVFWKLEEGDFCWYKPEIYEIDYNVPVPY